MEAHAEPVTGVAFQRAAFTAGLAASLAPTCAPPTPAAGDAATPSSRASCRGEGTPGAAFPAAAAAPLTPAWQPRRLPTGNAATAAAPTTYLSEPEAEAEAQSVCPTAQRAKVQLLRRNPR